MNLTLTAIALLLCCVLLMIAPINAVEALPRPKFDPANSARKQFKLLRGQIVQYQLRNRGIQDERVLTAMSKVPRHQFIGFCRKKCE